MRTILYVLFSIISVMLSACQEADGSSLDGGSRDGGPLDAGRVDEGESHEADSPGGEADPGEEGDPSEQGSPNENPGTQDGGADNVLQDAGTQLPAESRLGSGLTADEVDAVCGRLDEAAAITDLETACHAEAYLLTYDPAVCEELVDECLDAGGTVGASIEEPDACSMAAETWPDCEMTVAELIACHDDMRAFLAERKCTVASLEESGVECTGEVTSRCPGFVANEDTGPSPDDGGGGGGGLDGYCSGVSPLCSTQGSSGLCITVDGCYWSSSTDTCSGVSRSCSSYTDSIGCAGQSGCYWTE